MGTEAAWVPAVLALAGTAASVYNTQRTAKKQDATAAAGIRKQAENQRANNARINQTLQFAQQSKPDEARQRANQQYLDVLQAKRATANAGLAPQGVSGTFDTEAKAASAGTQARVEDIAGLMARIDAPTIQRQQEQAVYGNLGMDLDRMTGSIRGDQFLNQLRLNSIRRNPWIDLAAGAAQGYASGYGASAGQGSAPSMQGVVSDIPQTIRFNYRVPPGG